MTKRKRLVRGKDWHAWAWKWRNGELSMHALYDPDTSRNAEKGEYVRVKFVEVRTTEPR